jgi:hypothetical protein
MQMLKTQSLLFFNFSIVFLSEQLTIGPLLSTTLLSTLVQSYQIHLQIILPMRMILNFLLFSAADFAYNIFNKLYLMSTIGYHLTFNPTMRL